LVCTGLQESSAESLGPAAESLTGVWSLSNDDNISAMEAAAPTASKVVIYGDTLQAYGALQRVIAAGASPGSVALVTPPAAEGAANCFSSTDVENLVGGHLEGLGVTLYQGYTLTGVEGNAEGCLASAVFESEGKSQGITCDVLGCFADPNTDTGVAKALNDNALVYDGRLVVNALFQSNDPAVMAAGSVTKFSRRYGRSSPVQFYNSREVGTRLGKTVIDLAIFDGANLDADTLPSFTQAKAKGCILPGLGDDLHFFCAALPGGKQGAGGTEGRHLTTQSTAADGSPSYCSVYVDKFDAVESITYLGTERLEWANLMKLIGLPQVLAAFPCVWLRHVCQAASAVNCSWLDGFLPQGYINRLVMHFDEKLVPSLTDWFRQPWAMALYHDRFPELVQALKADLKGQSDVAALVQELMEWAERRDQSEMTTEALATLRQPLVSKLDVSSRRLAKKLTEDYVQNNVSMLWMIMEAEQ